VKTRSGLTVGQINGVKIAVYPIQGMTAGAMAIRVRGGSWYEPIGKLGAAHFLEHLMMDSTEALPTWQKMEEFKQRYGIEVGAWTGGEDYLFRFSFPVRYWAKTVWLADQILFHPLITDENMNKELGVISQEYRDKWNDPFACYHHFMNQKVYGEKNWFIRDGIGEMNNIRKVDRDYLMGWHEKYFVNGNMMLGVSGGMEAELVLTNLNGMLNKVPKNGIKKIICQSIDPSRGISHFNGKIDRCQVNVSWVWLGQRMNYREGLAMSMLREILGSGANSRLFNKLRQELGLVYEIEAFGYYSAGVYTAGVMTSTEVERIEKVVDLINIEVGRLLNGMMNKEELNRTRRFMDLRTLMSYSSPYHIAESLLDQLWYDGAAHLPKETIAEARKAPVEKIRKVLKKEMTPQKAVITVSR
jgi:predicted Zn-dependent peptidase